MELCHRKTNKTIMIMAITFSTTGNIIAITGPECIGSDLVGHEDAIVKAMDEDFVPDQISAHTDVQWFKAKLDRVPTHNVHGNRTSPQEICNDVGWSF
jgi:hypothetical protein